LSSFANLSCEAANLFGWQVGGVSSSLAIVLLLVRILLSPTLGPLRGDVTDHYIGWRRVLRCLLVLMPVAWLWGAYWLGWAFGLCYARGLAFSTTIMFGVLLLVATVSAANQIGRRSVR
jgi:hypothetical protein